MTERDSSTHLEYVLGESPTAIVLQNCRFAWSKEPNGFVLDVERLEIPSGQLVGIYGKVGSGKTSLLSSMLGEMISIEPEKENFKAKINKSIGYVSQSAWIQSRNVKQNILFFNEFDKPFYENVVHCTALEEDFKMLASGDSTQIGEKGINLSGGQKQRIALARAVYAKKELYILDDPLSAVDVHVSKHIFKKVVSNKGILNNTTRLFVTNNPIFLAKCDRVLIIEEGKIIADDKYENLTSQYDFFSEQNTLEAQHGDETPSPNVHEITPTSILHSTTGQQSKHFIQNQLRRMTNADSVAEESLYSDDIGAKKTADDFFTGERVQLGLVIFS
ncbi:MAG: Canalicular multispecific organic anion transporter 1 [Paramarteilia canceri]